MVTSACLQFTDALTFELIMLNAAVQTNANANTNMNLTGTHSPYSLFYTIHRSRHRLASFRTL